MSVGRTGGFKCGIGLIRSPAPRSGRAVAAGLVTVTDKVPPKGLVVEMMLASASVLNPPTAAGHTPLLDSVAELVVVLAGAGVLGLAPLAASAAAAGCATAAAVGCAAAASVLVVAVSFAPSSPPEISILTDFFLVKRSISSTLSPSDWRSSSPEGVERWNGLSAPRISTEWSQAGDGSWGV